MYTFLCRSLVKSVVYFMSVGLVETKQWLRIHTALHNADSEGMHRG